MRRLFAYFGLVLALVAASASPALAKSRIKDIVEFEGVRENMLVGYGLVVGLNGTGDSLRNAPFTKQSLEAMLERLGVNVRDANLNTKNVAAVMVTARLPAFAAAGSQIDVTVSAMGDAKSLLGGTLLVTPLLGADGQAYAVAQGTVQTGSVSASGPSGSSVTQGRADGGPHRRRRHRRARDRLPARQHGPDAPDPAQSRLHHRPAHRRRDQRRYPGHGHGREPDHRRRAHRRRATTWSASSPTSSS